MYMQVYPRDTAANVHHSHRVTTYMHTVVLMRSNHHAYSHQLQVVLQAQRDGQMLMHVRRVQGDSCLCFFCVEMTASCSFLTTPKPQ